MSGKWLEAYGPVVGLMFGWKKALAVSGPRSVLEVLHRDEFQGRPFSSRLMGRLLNRRLGKWTQQMDVRHGNFIYKKGLFIFPELLMV
jgi:hypothetical protein